MLCPVQHWHPTVSRLVQIQHLQFGLMLQDTVKISCGEISAPLDIILYLHTVTDNAVYFWCLPCWEVAIIRDVCWSVSMTRCPQDDASVSFLLWTVNVCVHSSHAAIPVAFLLLFENVSMWSKNSHMTLNIFVAIVLDVASVFSHFWHALGWVFCPFLVVPCAPS